MKATEMLIEEHVLIRQMLSHLSQARKMIETDQRPPKALFEKAVFFSRNFTDKYHHFKEEYLMFGLLANKKEGILEKRLTALKYEHERGCQFIETLSHSISEYAKGDDFATTTLLENIASYTSILKRHIFVEDHIFFPLVEKVLSDQEDRELVIQFQKESQRMGGSNFVSDCHTLVLEIEAMVKAGWKK
jgi:hemerythrin-like domain-containing protein